MDYKNVFIDVYLCINRAWIINAKIVENILIVNR